MTLVSNDPIWWPQINLYLVSSYVGVATSTVLVYDWALTFGKEVELVWRRRNSLMNIMYVCVRYGGILYSVISMILGLPSVQVADLGCSILFFAEWWMSVVENAMLGVIMIARLHAMYQRSRILLIFLIVIFAAFTMACIVITAILNSNSSLVEFILSGTYECIPISESETAELRAVTWILGSVWEVLALCLALIVAAKHFHELRRFRLSGGQTMIEDCFTVLIKTHVLYFAFFAVVSCLVVGLLSPNIANSTSIGVQIYSGCLQFLLPVQMFVLGPRLILSVREYHAALVANSETGIAITTIAFQESAHVSTGSDV